MYILTGIYYTLKENDLQILLELILCMKKLKKNDEKFKPGAGANETIYYNFLNNLISLRNLN